MLVKDCMETPTSIDGNEVRRWCREGMYCEVEAWLQAGHSISTDGDKMRSPLVLASENGFHSLVKLLLGQIVWPQRCLDAALGRAAAGGHFEVTRLLLETGACICDVAPKELVVCGNPEVVYLLVSKGVDIETRNPLAHAIFREVPQALVLLKRGQKRLATIRRQGAIALRQHVIYESEHGAERLYRAGCDSRLEVPDYNAYLFSPRSCSLPSSAMWETFKTGSFRLFMIMGPTKKKELQYYLNHSWFCDFNWPKMQMLIRRGAKVNDQPNGGSDILHSCLWRLRDFAYGSFGRERAEYARLTIRKLAEAGAKWVPDESMIRDARYGLRELDNEKAFELAQTLFETKAAKPKLIWKFFNTPTVREKRSAVWLKVAELLGLKVKPYKKRESKKKRKCLHGPHVASFSSAMQRMMS